MQILATDRPPALDRAALAIRRVDAIPVALPLRKPVRMAAETVTHARNILVRIEAADGMVGWGEAASAPTMTGDTLGGLTAAVRSPRAGPDRCGRLDATGADEAAAHGAPWQYRRAFRRRDGSARSGRPGIGPAADRSRGRRVAPRGCADVARRQCDAGRGRCGGESQGPRGLPL